MNTSRTSVRALVVSTLLALGAGVLPATTATAAPTAPAQAASTLEPLPTVPSTVGTDHWVTFPRLYNGGGVRKLFVTTSGGAATVTATSATGVAIATTTVAPDAVARSPSPPPTR